MAGLQSSHWKQWDSQCTRRREVLAYVELNNLYLSIECGETSLTVTTANRLRVLVGKLDESRPVDSFECYMDSVISQYWETEFEKLPGWFDV